MNVNRIRFFVILALAAGFLCNNALAVQRGRGNQQPQGAQESTMLQYMREEEKLARDVYLTLHEKWGAQIFSNIARAESQHMAAIANLLAKYNIADPVETDTRGVFAQPQLQELYDSLVAAGSNSLLDAISVGLQIEELDIADLRSAMAATERADIQNVLRNLERASQNHLRAFSRQLLRMGGAYNATRLTQEEFNAIATATGPARGNVKSGPAGRQADNAISRRGRGRRRGGQGRGQ